MKLVHHITISAIITGILYAIFRLWSLSIAFFITGILTDMDHVIDYLKENGLRFHLQDFFHFFYGEEHRKITLIFHGWELLLISGVAAKSTDWNPWVTGACGGYGVHIISDYIFSKAPFRSYSLLWRWSKGFDSFVIFPRDRGYNPSGREKNRK